MVMCVWTHSESQFPAPAVISDSVVVCNFITDSLVESVKIIWLEQWNRGTNLMWWLSLMVDFSQVPSPRAKLSVKIKLLVALLISSRFDFQYYDQ